MDYTNREVFPASPLALVAAEVRFSVAPRLRQQATLDEIAIALESRFPVQQPPGEGMSLLLGGDASQLTIGQGGGGLLLRDVSGTTALTILPNRMTLETTAYSEFPAFKADLVTSCDALAEAGVISAIERVGLRYIDEIRVPAGTISDARDWADWIDPRLVDHVSVGPRGVPVTMSQGLISYMLDEQRTLNVRFAALPNGAVVQPTTLARKPFVEGPLFVLDFDGSQDMSGATATLFSTEVISSAIDAVHGPAGETFQNTITDRARELFRRRTA